HALGILLLWRLLVRLRVPGAWWAAVIFAVHPVCVESVAWITELRNTLPFCLGLGAMLCYLRVEPIDSESNGGANGVDRFSAGQPKWYALSLLLFTLALLSKTQLVGLPIVLALIFWWKRGSVGWPVWKRLAPMLAIAVFMSAVTVLVEWKLDPAVKTIEPLSPVGRVLLAGQAVWFYVGKLVWPARLTFIYPRIVVNSAVCWQYLYPLAALGVVVALWFNRRKIGRGPLAAALVFICLLAPVLGLVSARHIKVANVADHFQYPAAAALVALAVAATYIAATKLGDRIATARIRPIFNCLAGLLIGAYVVLSWQQSRLYANATTLSEDTLGKNPNCWLAHNNLGNVLLQAGKIDEAIAHYQQAVAIKPDYAEAHANWGTALAAADRFDEAIEHFQKAINLKQSYALAYNDLAQVLAKLGRTAKAIENYRQAITLVHDYADAHNNLGVVLLASGQRDDAVAHLRQAVLYRPDYAEAHSNLGSALVQLGHTQQAIDELETAVKLDPTLPEAQNLLGAALATRNQSAQAIVHYRQAVQLNPNYAEAHYNLAAELMDVGRPQEAVGHLKKVLHLRPNDLQAGVDLAMAYAQLNQPSDAIAAAQHACDLARTTGKAADAEKIQMWLNAYRVKQNVQR
ncbi:MAG TPA: tetratricopeptide repeat protein, partial [Pirellulales bacterium]